MSGAWQRNATRNCHAVSWHGGLDRARAFRPCGADWVGQPHSKWGR